MSQSTLSEATKKVQSFALTELSDDKLYQAYDRWADEGSYDEDMAAVMSRGPVILAQVFAELYPESARKICILDVAAGTGRGGEELAKLGFFNMDALDPAHKMLEVAKSKNIYNKLICAPLGDNPVDIADGSYDAVACVGGLAEGHLPASSIVEMVRLVRKGGLVVMVSNGSTWDSLPEYKVKMAGIIDKMKQDGKIQINRQDLMDGYRMKSEDECARAIIFVLEKL